MSTKNDDLTKQTEKKSYGFWAFIPILTFLIIYIGAGLIFSALGSDNPFRQIPRETALLIGVLVALFMSRKMNIEDKVEILCRSAGQTSVMYMVFIFLVAGAFSGICTATGGAESVVNLGLTYIPKHFMVAGIFIMSSILSMAMGSSTATCVALSPIAISVSNGAGISPALAIAAMWGGSMFGDNLSFISDTTIAATQGVGAEMKDKFRMNVTIAIPAFILAVIIYCNAPVSTESLGAIGDHNAIHIIPYLAVIITALMGMNVLLVLFIGIGIASVIGLALGSVNLLQILQAAGEGMNGMVGISLAAILIRGLIGVTQEFGGIDWLVKTLLKKVHSRKSAEYCIAALAALLSFALANNTLSILIAAPVVKPIGESYNISPRRMASLLDIFSCVMLEFAPHTGSMIMITAMIDCSPLDIFKGDYYTMLLGLFSLITIQFGLLRTKKEKESEKKISENATA